MISTNLSRRSMTPLVSISILVLLVLGQSCPAGQSSIADELEYAKQLVAQYEELESELEATIEAAEIADPNLREFKIARDKMKRWYDDDLGPAKRKWLQWKSEQPDPKEADALYRRLEGWAGAISFARDLEDPNHGPFIRYIVLPILIEGAKDPNMVVGPYTSANEKDEDKLWEGYKRFGLEQAAWCQAKLDQYIQEKNIPPWIVQLAGDTSRGESYLMFYKVAIDQRTPPAVHDIKQNMLAVCRELALILPQWNQLRGQPDDQWRQALEQNRQK